MLKNISSRKGVKFYLLQALLFLALVFAADRITGGFLQYLYKKQAAGWDYRTRYSAEETNAEVLIFGASRAQQQYIPTFIEDSLQLTCYNVGRDGTPFFYQYAMLQMILKRYTPKIIILDCEYAILKKTATSYERMSSLLPLYNEHPEIRSIIELRSPYEKYKFISRVYPYNSMFFKIAVANLGSQKKKKEDIKGYLPLYASLNEPLKTIDHTSEYELDSLKINMLYSFIEDCQQRNIELYLFCPPYYLNTIGTDHSFAVTKAISAEKKVDFIDYSKDPHFLKRPHLFDDTVHVNYEGAKIISARIAGEIKKRTKIK